jgi:hypothetical protein
MDRQRSFSFKPTRLLVFSFTISTSAILFTFFTIWVIKATPSFRQEIHLQFNKSSFNFGLRPITVQTFSGNFSVTGEKDSILIDTQYRSLENTSGFGSISVLSGLQLQIEKDGPAVLVDGGGKSDGLDGNLTTMQESTAEALSEKIEVPKSERNKEKVVTVATSSEKTGVSIRAKVRVKRVKDCDLTKGRWVYDESYPLYTKGSCPFIDEGFNCEGNGRLDKNYMKWRWQPQDCEIPRY